MDISVFVIEILSQLFIWMLFHLDAILVCLFLFILLRLFYRST
jgi:hypothetical protein